MSEERIDRFYSCSHCGHGLRYDAPNCGECWASTPFYNRRRFWRVILPAGIGAAIVAAGLLAILLS